MQVPSPLVEGLENASAFVQYTVLDTIDKEHRKQINPRKRTLLDAAKSTMVAKREKTHTEDGKNYFVLGSSLPKAKLNKKFKQLAYENFQKQLNRQLIPNEYDVYEKFIETSREQVGGEVKTTVTLSKSRPPESFFAS